MLEVATDLILNEKIMNSIAIEWHELYPSFSNYHNLTSWEEELEDPFPGRLSPGDQIDMFNKTSGETEWYHVDRVTFTMLVSNLSNPEITMYIELKDIPFQDLYLVKTTPWETLWHEVYPRFCLLYEIYGWEDDCNGVLGYCDIIDLGEGGRWHIEEVTIDIVASRYPWVYQGLVDPTDVTIVNEGDYTETVDVYAFYDGIQAAPKQTVVMNPGDVVTLTFNWLTEGVAPSVYTISASAVIPLDEDPGDNGLIGNTEQIVLSPPLYWKDAYPDYAPSGMPDFDQRQDAWDNPPGSEVWSWCAPTAVANSLWWYDSKYETNTVPSPAMVDNYPLVTSYSPGVWDDHDLQNVPPLIQHLAYLMDTDGQRTGQGHFGTWVWDIQAGIAQYLSWSSVNPLGDVNGDGTVNQTDVDIVNAAMGSTPGASNWDMRADIEPVTLGWPTLGVADNDVDENDLALVMANLGQNGTSTNKPFKLQNSPSSKRKLKDLKT